MTTQPKHVQLVDILDAVERKITPLVTARRHHYFSSIDQNVRIKTDPNTLQLLLLSLLTAAINNTPNRSLIGLTIRNSRSTRKLSICVADNGPLKQKLETSPYFIPVTGALNPAKVDQTESRNRDLEVVKESFAPIGQFNKLRARIDKPEKIEGDVISTPALMRNKAGKRSRPR